MIDYAEGFRNGLERYDAIFGTVGNFQNQSTQNPGGRRTLWDGAKLSARNEARKELGTIKGMIEAGAVRAVIDRCYPLAQAAKAHRYVEFGGQRATSHPDGGLMKKTTDYVWIFCVIYRSSFLYHSCKRVMAWCSSWMSEYTQKTTAGDDASRPQSVKSGSGSFKVNHGKIGFLGLTILPDEDGTTF